MDEALKQAKEQVEKTSASWAEAEKFIRHILEGDITSDSHHVIIPLLESIQGTMTEGNERAGRLQEEWEKTLRTRAPSRIPAPREPSSTLRRAASPENLGDIERPAQRKRTTGPESSSLHDQLAIGEQPRSVSPTSPFLFDPSNMTSPPVAFSSISVLPYLKITLLWKMN